MKRVFAILLAALLLAGLCGTAYADDTVYSEGYFYYTVEDGSITIVGYFGNETEVTIPASIAGMPVNAVAPAAFAGTSVTKIYLPDTVMSYQDSEGGRIDVVFDYNTDHPYTVSSEDQVENPDGLPEDEHEENTVIDLDAIEGRDELLQSVSPSPAPTAEPEEGGAGEPADEASEEPAEGTDEEKSLEEPSEKSPVPAIVGAAALAIAAVMIILRRIEEKKKKNEAK